MITVEGSWCLHHNAWCCLAAFTAFTPSTHGWTYAQDFQEKDRLLGFCILAEFYKLVWDRMKSPVLEIKARWVIADRTDDKCLPSSHPFRAQTFPSGGIHQSHHTYRCFLNLVECFSKDLPKLQFSQWMNFIGNNFCFWFGFVHHTTFSMLKPH